MTLFEWLWLDSVWKAAQRLYPVWLAPNLITLAGFLCIMVTGGLGRET